MKKIWVLFIVILLIVLLSNFFLKIQQKIQLDEFSNQINDILNFKNEENIKILDKIILTNKIFLKDMDVEWINYEINKMVNNLKIKIGNEGNPEIIMSKINNFFFEEQYFKFDVNINNFLSGKSSDYIPNVNEWIDLHSIEKILKNKKGICLSLSLIYLIIAEQLNLPIYGILMPGHMYVRYESSGRSGINVETTFSGKEFYDYFSYSGIDILNKEKVIYGKKLNKQQVISAYLNNIGIIFMLKNEIEKSKIIYDKILQIMPDLPEVYNNIACIYIRKKNFIKAEDTLKMVIEIYPENLIANINLGILYFNEKRYNMAEIYLKKSLNLYPNNSEVKKMLNKINDIRGN